MRAPAEYNHLEVLVQSGGYTLPEHHEVCFQPTSTMPATFASYLEIPNNAPVCLVVRCPSQAAWQGDLMSAPEIDGRSLTTAYLKAGSTGLIEHATYEAGDDLTGDNVQYHLICSREVERGEEGEDVLLHGWAHEVLGEIVVNIWRGTLHGVLSSTNSRGSSTGRLDTDAELAHFNGTLALEASTRRFEDIGDASPWCRFFFRYATREALLALRIISEAPHPPSPSLSAPAVPHTPGEQGLQSVESVAPDGERYILVPASPDLLAAASDADRASLQQSTLLVARAQATPDTAHHVGLTEEMQLCQAALHEPWGEPCDIHNPDFTNYVGGCDSPGHYKEGPVPLTVPARQSLDGNYQALYEALSLIPPQELCVPDDELIALVNGTTGEEPETAPHGTAQHGTAKLIRAAPTTEEFPPAASLAPYSDEIHCSTRSGQRQSDMTPTRDTTRQRWQRHPQRASAAPRRVDKGKGREVPLGDTTVYQSAGQRGAGIVKPDTGQAIRKRQVRRTVVPEFYCEELWSSDDDRRHAYTVKQGQDTSNCVSTVRGCVDRSESGAGTRRHGWYGARMATRRCAPVLDIRTRKTIHRQPARAPATWDTVGRGSIPTRGGWAVRCQSDPSASSWLSGAGSYMNTRRSGHGPTAQTPASQPGGLVTMTQGVELPVPARARLPSSTLDDANRQDTPPERLGRRESQGQGQGQGRALDKIQSSRIIDLTCLD